VSMINIALVNRQPRTMGLKELIQHFVTHRKEVITRRTKFQLRKAQQRAHILEGLVYAVCDIDEVVRLIRSSKTREEAIQKLRERAFRIVVVSPADRFAQLVPDQYLSYDANVLPHNPEGHQRPIRLTQPQAESIGRLQLIQLVGLELEKLVNELKEVMDQIQEYSAILANENALLDIIREDIFEIKEKYGDDRRTQITGDATNVNMEDLIAKEDVVVTVSHEGYIKRMPTDTYRAQSRGGRGIKGTESREGDFVEHLFVANTHDHLLFFTNQGRVYERRVYDVPEMSRTSQGRSVANLLSFQQGEKIASVLAITDFNREEQFLMFATAKGVVKKTALSAYSNIRTNGIIAIGLEDEDTLIHVACTEGKDHIILGTRSGLAIRFEEADVRAMGRPAGGVTGARFKRDGDAVVAMLVVTNGDNTGLHVLTACVNGYGKRTPLEEYPVKGRGTRGVINIDANDRNGDVVGMKIVGADDELMLITEKGILIRTGVQEIRETGRNASGVRLMKLDERDKLVAMAKVDKEDVVPEAASETPADGTPPGNEAPSGDGAPPEEPTPT
jgi:DNA gyrase subunit A